MNNGRRNHSTCCLGEHVYVFGGSQVYTDSFGSVESLHVGIGTAWMVILQPSRLNTRSKTAVAVLSQHQIACFGGLRDGDYLNDGYILDIRDNSET